MVFRRTRATSRSGFAARTEGGGIGEQGDLGNPLGREERPVHQPFLEEDGTGATRHRHRTKTIDEWETHSARGLTSGTYLI